MSYGNYRGTRQYQSKAEYMEYMRAYDSSVTDATYEEQEIDVPISRSYGNNRALAVAIHEVEFDIAGSAFEHIAGETAYVYAHLSKKTKTDTALLGNDQDIICKMESVVHTIAAGTTTSVLNFPMVWKPSKPVLIGNNKLYAGFKQNTGGALAMSLRVGFTPRFVSDNQLMEALID